MGKGSVARRCVAIFVVGAMVLASFVSINAVAGLPPVAVALPGYQAVALEEYAYFNGTASYDPDGFIFGEENYTWFFGDGNSGIGMFASHKYETPGSYMVNLTVWDDTGMAGCDYCIVNVTGNLSAPTVGVDKTVDRAIAYPGDILTYTISFANTGLVSADYVWINDTLPTGMAYISDSAASLPYFTSRNIAGNNINYRFANVPPGMHVFTITARINGNVLDGALLSNHVTCDYEPSGVVTEDWAVTTVSCPSIALSKTVDKATASPGDFLDYTLWFNNTGSGTAASASFNDTLPAGVTYVNDTASEAVGATFVFRAINGGNLFFEYTGVMPGVHYFTIRVQVDGGVAYGTNLTNWALCIYTTPNDYYSLPQTSDYAMTVIAVAPPDISISADGIAFSDPNPHLWDDITIDAETHNTGSLNAVCTVSFYLDNASEEYLIWREFEFFVPAGGYATVSAYWNANADGNHTIIVDITDSDPPEADMGNNQASKQLFVSPTCGELKVKACSDKQKYVSGVDEFADISVKVTYLGQPIEGASVSARIIAPDLTNTSITITEASRGTYVGRFYFGVNSSVPGTYRIMATASGEGYLDGENDGSKDKFFLDHPGDAAGVTITPAVAGAGDTVHLAVEAPGGAERVSLRGARNGVTYRLPLYDDGTHGDATPSDGICSIEIQSSELVPGSYVADVSVGDVVYETQGVLCAFPPDSAMVDALTFSGSAANVASATTNLTLNFTFATPIHEASIVIVEHRTANDGKSYEIVADARITASMIMATMTIHYSAADIPAGVTEDDMVLNVYNPYIQGYEACDPTGVDTFTDTLWGDVEHFSDFLVSKVPVRFGVPVFQGWNLISIPIATGAANLVEILDDCGMGTRWDCVMYYDSADTADHWKRYYTGWPSSFNDLSVIPAGAAFWLRVAEMADGLLVVEGDSPTSTDVTLHAGWNMVGYRANDDRAYTIGQFRMDTGATAVEGMDLASEYRSAGLGDAHVMKRGEGYWVYATVDTVWTVDW
ncbi:MAG: PKD domain-containing protein [Methanobacteriota archaeon]